MIRPCHTQDCRNPAHGVLAFLFYPPEALMRHYRTSKPLTHMVLGVDLCTACARKVVPAEWIGTQLYTIVKTIEQGSGVAVDMAATKPTLLDFNHPSVLKLLEQQRAQQGLQG